jgi:hypothetical protein
MNRLCEYLDLENDLNYTDDFQKNFNILYGSYSAGNDSIHVKNQLKNMFLLVYKRVLFQNIQHIIFYLDYYL